MFRRVLPVFAATLLVACGSGDEPASVDVAAAPTAAPEAASQTTAASATAAPDTATDTATTDTPANAATASTAAPGDTAPPADVPAALQLTAPLVGGGEIELGAYAGRPVLLWFWAPW